MREAVRRLGLHPNTLRKYADEDKIRYIRTPTGQRRFDVESFIKGVGGEERTICYCRVSSKKQEDDLSRQTAFMREQFKGSEVVTDIGSGINFRRKGLLSILERAMRGDKFTLVVAHRDRLCRFGFELVQFIIEQNGGKLVVLDKTVHSPQSELTQDLLSILHVFSCRMHGLRKYGHQIKKDKNLSSGGTKSEA